MCDSARYCNNNAIILQTAIPSWRLFLSWLVTSVPLGTSTTAAGCKALLWPRLLRGAWPLPAREQLSVVSYLNNVSQIQLDSW